MDWANSFDECATAVIYPTAGMTERSVRFPLMPLLVVIAWTGQRVAAFGELAAAMQHMLHTLIDGLFHSRVSPTCSFLRYPYDEKKYARGWETFERLVGIAEGHLTAAGTPFLVGTSITLAVSEGG
jgi:hypothetical protein